MLDWRKEVEDMLKADADVSALVGENVYKVTCQKDEGFPRIIIVEAENDPSYWSDDSMWEAHILTELWIWAKAYDEWIAMIAAVDKAMVAARWSRKRVEPDRFVRDVKVYEKVLTYSRSKLLRK